MTAAALCRTPGGHLAPMDRYVVGRAPGPAKTVAAEYGVSQATVYTCRGELRGRRKDRKPRRPRAVTDPFALTPIQRVAGIWVKRDDLFTVGGVPGGKVRTCLALAQAAKLAGKQTLVTAGSRASPQVNIVAHIAKLLGMAARCHTPTGKLSPEVEAAQAAGATIVQHKAGYNSVIIARANEDAEACGGAVIPFGMECDEAVRQTRAQVAKLPSKVARLVVPVGSGMSLAGILWGLHDAGRSDLPVLGVVVGADPSKRLTAYAPLGWQTHTKLVPAGIDYHAPAPATQLDGINLDAHYEAKCLPFLQPSDLLWVVGIRQTALT